MIKISELLKGQIHPLVHGALLSRRIKSRNNEFFATVYSYQSSRKILDQGIFEDSINNLNYKLNRICGDDFWISIEQYNRMFKDCNLILKGKEKSIMLIHNDLMITDESFYNRLYSKLFTDSQYIFEDFLNEEKRNFIRGFCELRGSIDTNHPFISMDYFYSSKFELDKARILTDYMNVPHEVMNLNFRDLQNQFVKGINKRNTQLRLQLNWYANNIGFINDYKVEIIKKSYNIHSISKSTDITTIRMPDIESRKSNTFLTRLNHYSTNIYGSKLSDSDIQAIRNELGFDIENELIHFTRNREIVELVRLFTDDKCAGCQDVHEIETRSFLHRKTNRYYFEIHHNISLSGKLELDHENNLVKLCPVCHSCLKNNVGLEIEQKKIIKNILLNNQSVKEFASSFFDMQDDVLLINKIYSSLK